MLLDILYCLLLVTVSPLVIYRSARFGRYRRGIRQKFCGLQPDDLEHLGIARPRELGDYETRSRQAAGWPRLGGTRPSGVRGPEPVDHDRASEPSPPPPPLVWFHAVSVGEVNLIAGLVAAYRAANPEHRVVISTTTDTGYDLARSRFSDLPVFFLPLDLSWAVKRTFQTLRPSLLVLAELEIWPNLVRFAQHSGCRVAIANGRLSERSGRRYQRLRRFFAPTFQRLDWVGCQDAESARRFLACGTRQEALTITGSIKFDNAPENRDTLEVHRLARWTGVDPWHQVLIAGSTQAGEELAALATYRELSPLYRQLRLIIVPRHKERFDEVAELIRGSGFQLRRRSDQHSPAEHWSADTVILADTIGELRHWWGLSRIAFVGGSFGNRGGQNMLEPAGYGCATCFGPHTENFAEIASRLLQADAAVRVPTPAEFTRFVAKCLEQPHQAEDLGLRARAVVQKHRGATAKTVEQLGRLVAEHPAAVRRAA